MFQVDMNFGKMFSTQYISLTNFGKEILFCIIFQLFTCKELAATTKIVI